MYEKPILPSLRQQKQVQTFVLSVLLSQQRSCMDTAVMVALVFVVLKAFDPEEVDRAGVAMCLIL